MKNVGPADTPASRRGRKPGYSSDLWTTKDRTLQYDRPAAKVGSQWHLKLQSSRRSARHPGPVARADPGGYAAAVVEAVMFSRLWGIVTNSFTETIRQPIYGVLLLVTTGLLVLNVGVSGYTLEDDNKLLKDLGLSTLLLSGLFLAAFSSAGILSREIDNKTVLTVISKPVSRPLFLAGKFVGLSGALAVAFYLVGVVFLLTMRHKVMERASQDFDMPVILFGVGALLGSIILAAFCNYLYDMQFASTAIALALPLMTLALGLVALISPEWQIQSFGKDFVDGQLIGAAVLVFGMVLILTSVAVATSTRFGQVVTLTICMAVLLVGLVSDTMFGQYRDTNLFARLAYWISPNLAFLWVTDALTQDNRITLGYVGMTFGYAMLIVFAWLFIGVAMFQKREVG
jgi:ABC-type transport system involved in multi-copper enzyme maturation permease subunit